MQSHICDGPSCTACAKNKYMMVAAGVGIVVILGAIFFAVWREDGTPNRVQGDYNAKNVALENGGNIARNEDERVMVMEGERIIAQDDNSALGGENVDNARERSHGVYREYAPELVGKTERTILEFSATWCSSCRAFDADITEKAQEIPAGVTVLKVDYDTRGDLRKKYGIRTQNTFVEVDKAGNKVKTVIGGTTLAGLISDFAL